MIEPTMLEPIEIDVTRLPSKGHLVKFSATEKECQAICRGFDLLAVESLSAELRLTRWRRTGVAVKGALKAKIIQPCVISLEPVEQTIDEDISVIYVPEGSPLARPEINDSGEMLLDPEGDDIPDTFNGTHVIISEVILEALALAIDPHPRRPGVHLSEEYSNDEIEDEKPVSPFAVLSQLKK